MLKNGYSVTVYVTVTDPAIANQPTSATNKGNEKRSTSRAKYVINTRWSENEVLEEESVDDQKLLGRKKLNELTDRYKYKVYNAVKDDVVQAVMKHVDEIAKDDAGQIQNYIAWKMMGADEPKSMHFLLLMQFYRKRPQKQRTAL